MCTSVNIHIYPSKLRQKTPTPTTQETKRRQPSPIIMTLINSSHSSLSPSQTHPGETSAHAPPHPSPRQPLPQSSSPPAAYRLRDRYLALFQHQKIELAVNPYSLWHLVLPFSFPYHTEGEGLVAPVIDCTYRYTPAWSSPADSPSRHTPSAVSPRPR